MAWQDPFTDWGPGSVVTYEDMNRIGGNLNYLLDRNAVKADYTASDYVFLTEWETIRTALAEVQAYLGMEEDLPDDAVSSYNFNLVETYTLEAKDPVDKRRAQRLANQYAGDGWFSDAEVFTGGY